MQGKTNNSVKPVRTWGDIVAIEMKTYGASPAYMNRMIHDILNTDLYDLMGIKGDRKDEINKKSI